jgi:hypothetical protein
MCNFLNWNLTIALYETVEGRYINFPGTKELCE